MSPSVVLFQSRICLDVGNQLVEIILHSIDHRALSFCEPLIDEINQDVPDRRIKFVPFDLAWQSFALGIARPVIIVFASTCDVIRINTLEQLLLNFLGYLAQ